MTRDRIEVILGVLIIFTALSGLPVEIRRWIFCIAAAIIIALAIYASQKEYKKKKKLRKDAPDTFEENRPQIRNTNGPSNGQS